jgi:hypothetical protein
MDSNRFNNFSFLNNFLFNEMIAKIDTHKIEHLSNIEIFVRDYNNLVESKLKQIIKTN